MDKDFPMICMMFRYSWRDTIFIKMPLSHTNHLNTWWGWDFNEKIATGSIFQTGPSYTTLRQMKLVTHFEIADAHKYQQPPGSLPQTDT